MQYKAFIPSSMSFDEECIHNSDLFTLYQANLPNQSGKLLSIIFPEAPSEDLEIQISPRIRLKLAYVNDNIKGLTLTTYNAGTKKGEITLSSFTLGHISEFLDIIKSINISDLTQRKLSLNLDSENQPKDAISDLIIKTLNEGDQAELIKQFLTNGIITNQDIVNTGYRKLALEKFRKLLNDQFYIEQYKDEYDIHKASIEKVWQHFFKYNQWIFGYGLDYRFQSILQDEANLNTANIAGRNNVNADFLLADNKFTTFVEIKRPDTRLFSEVKNRSNCWKLSTDLYDAHSQILEHKACGQIKLAENKIEYDHMGNEITQKAYDSKTILIIGSWKEINTSSNHQARKIKERTFELFRQNSKNVEIITFDELYNRAKFIVEHS